MADIAKTAATSPGLMYRYFPGKEAIVLAIIERQLQERRAKIAELHASNDFASSLVRSFEQWRTGDPGAMNVALFLEMSAEATRDRQTAAALRCSDLLTRADFKAWLGASPTKGGLGVRKDLETRAILIQCVIEGLAIRAVREPDLDVVKLRPALRRLLDHPLEA